MRAVVLALVTVLVAGPPLFAGTLRGKVTTQSGEPISRVQVSLKPAAPGAAGEVSTHTSREGWFQFDGVKPGSYRLVAQKKGWVTREETVTLAEGVPQKEVHLTLGLTLLYTVFGGVQLGTVAMCSRSA